MKFSIVLVVFVVLLSVGIFARKSSDPDYVPAVLWHGMGDNCCDPLSMGRIKRLIEKTLPGIYVYSVEVTDSIIGDTIAGFIGDVNDQITQISGKISANSNLSKGYNSVGFSQGSQFLRGLAQRYPEPPMYNLVSMGGQHQGVFGLPDCNPDGFFCNETRVLLDCCAYWPEIQKISVQAQYWHDSINEEKYVDGSAFIADINNEKPNEYNATYKENLLKLTNLVLVQFLNDTVVIPKESEWFGFYAAGTDYEVVPYYETSVYINDTIGLKELNETGRLQFLGCPGNHLKFTDDWFVEYIILPYLNVTF